MSIIKLKKCLKGGAAQAAFYAVRMDIKHHQKHEKK